MSISRSWLSTLSLSCCVLTQFACGATLAPPPPAPAPPTSAPAPVATTSKEPHLANIRQLTFEGENAEAYWSFDGQSLTMQSKLPGTGCDRIRALKLSDPKAEFTPVSSGKGATTCSYFTPDNLHVIYASTHKGGDACPPAPDHSMGYVWALYDTYDIFKVPVAGGQPVQLTDSKGYDAEATICGVDGSIVFTSVRDGDIELYRMDADGGNVKRLTSTPGYDGGAFFNKDCSRIVWRASRPRTAKELEDFRGLLAQGLVRPTKLELYVANADGSNATQITYLNAASFAPYWHPSQHRILFASNYGDPKGREFDIWAVDDTGANLERITNTPSFDGFPMFSPDGKTLAFASNRNTPEGSRDTHVFLADWVEQGDAKAANPSTGPQTAATTTDGSVERVLGDIRFLADPVQQGRGVGSTGLATSGAFLEQRMKSLGLTPAGVGGGYRDPFSVPTALEQGPKTEVVIDKLKLTADQFVPLGFSPMTGNASGKLAFAGYGIVDKKLGVDDYKGLDVKGKIVVVRRFVPEGEAFAASEVQRRFGDLRYKTWLAKERGALAVIVIDDPEKPKAAPKDWKAPDEAKFPALNPEGYGNAGIPVVMLQRKVGHDLIAKLQRKQRVEGNIVFDLHTLTQDAFNVLGRIPAGVPDAQKLPGVVVIGAHYDHVGMGGRHSLAPDKHEPHVGADDNASGTAALLEIARTLTEKRASLKRDVIVAAFSAEESGLLGSSHLVHAIEEGSYAEIKPKTVFAMLNLDMVGRMRENRVQVLGTETATEWNALVEPACIDARIQCDLIADGGYGPSDQMSFFTSGVPVLHFFTGPHADYHKPTDTWDKVNAAGAGQIAKATADVLMRVSALDKPLSFNPGAKAPAPRGDTRSFNASLGTIPDYAGPGPGKSGVLLAGVRPGGAAEAAGLKRGDILVGIGKHDIQSIEDFMYVLNASKPNETTKVAVIRDGQRLELDVTFQEGGRR